jgi:ABC-2 type transport system ATP-binding protein
LIEDYAEHPRTIILSTHLIDEVSQLLEHIMVIDNGKLIINEDADALRGKAHTTVGLTSAVEAFVTNKEVIGRELLGGLTSATVMGTLTAAERKYAAELGIEITPVSLQQLIVYLTKGKSIRKEDSAS